MKKRHISFFMPVASQPRYHKRIFGFKKDSGVKCYYFTRNYFKGDPLEYPSYNLGVLSHKKYLQRLFKLIFISFKIIPELKNTNCIYCFGMDLVLCNLPAKWIHKCVLIYEIGDIRQIQLKNNFLGFFTRKLEKFLISQCDIVVVTAEGFSREYLQGRLSIDPKKIRIIENKLHGSQFPEQTLPKTTEQQIPTPYDKEHITIGYFGLVSCPKSWEILKLIAQKAPKNIKILIAGYIVNSDINEDIIKYDNISFIGEYVAPDDLEKMYSDIDIMWGCFPAPQYEFDINWKWARTNRFYESCFFSKPIIALEGSDEAKVVEDLDIGFSVDLTKTESVATQVIDKLSRLDQYNKNIASLSKSVYLYQNEHECLLEDIDKLNN